MGTASVHLFDCLIRVDFSSYPRATRVQKDNAHQSRSGQERSKTMVLLSQGCTFTLEINPNRVIVSHEDELVLTLRVSGFSVWRILQMSHLHEALENLDCILSRFNGATTISMGGALLPIEAEPVTLCLRFSMVGYLTPYNAILG
ncbi:hypothetical protein AAG906_029689 [Vitis piasezkii]